MSEYEAYGLRVNLANIAELHTKAMNSFNLSGAKPNHIGHIGAMTGDLRVAMRALTRELGFNMSEPGACSSSFYKNLLMMGATRGTEGILHFVEQNKKIPPAGPPARHRIFHPLHNHRDRFCRD